MSTSRAKRVRRWKHPVRDCSLLVVGALVAGVGSVVFWALTAEPGSRVDYVEAMRALVASHQPGGSKGRPLAEDEAAGVEGGWNAWEQLQSANGEFERATAPIVLPLPPGGGTPLPLDFGLVLGRYEEELALLPSVDDPARAGMQDWLDQRRDAARGAIPVVAMSPLGRALDRVAETPGGARTSYTSPLFTQLLPELGQMRRMAWYLAARMRGAGETGDSATVLECFGHTLATARVLAHQGFPIDRVVACAIAGLGMEEMRRYAGSGSMNADEARAALRMMDRQLEWPGLELPLEGARIIALDTVQQTHSAGGLLPGRFLGGRYRVLRDGGAGAVGSGTIANVGGLVSPTREETTRAVDALFDGVLSNIGLNARQRREHGFSEDEFAASLPAGQVVVRDFAGWKSGQVLATSDMHEALVGLTRLRLALLVHHQLRGEYPASLVELTPEFLVALPRDPFADDGAFVYRRDGEGFVLLSVGDDGHDDGGVAAPRPELAFEPGSEGTDFVVRAEK